jgi:hypothetical protein
MKRFLFLAGLLFGFGTLAAQPVIVVVQQPPPTTVVVHQDRAAYHHYGSSHYRGKSHCGPSRGDYRGKGHKCGCPPGHIKNGKCRHQGGRYRDHGHYRHDDYRRGPHSYPDRRDEGIVIEGGIRFRKRLP